MPDRFGVVNADKRRMTISLLTLSRPPFFNYQYGIFHPKYLIRNNPYGHSNRILPTKCPLRNTSIRINQSETMRNIPFEITLTVTPIEYSLRNVPFEILHSESINPKQSIRINQCELLHSITPIEYSLRNIPFEILQSETINPK